MKLTKGEKRLGTGAHASVATCHLFGVGGNRITSKIWTEYELERGPYDPMFKNPFLVFFKFGNGKWWGGADVAVQLREICQFFRWYSKRNIDFAWQVSCLPPLEGPRAHLHSRVTMMLGLDHSMTHCFAGLDAVALSKFNVGTKRRPGSNDPGSKIGTNFSKYFEGYGTFLGTVAEYDEESQLFKITYTDGDEEDLDWNELKELIPVAKGQKQSTFAIPHDVKLTKGDIDETGISEYNVGDIYSFTIDENSYKGKKQIAEELGWHVMIPPQPLPCKFSL